MQVNFKEDVLCVYSKRDPKYQTLPPNTKFCRNGLDLIPGNISGSIQEDVAHCGMNDTPTIEDGGSVRLLSSESGVGSSISSGCSFQSNSINSMSGGGKESEIESRPSGLPITTHQSSIHPILNAQPQNALSSLNTSSDKGLSDHSLHSSVPSSTSSSIITITNLQQNNTASASSDNKTSSNNDWQKSRRRPVVVDEDMEKQLSAPDCDVIELTQKHFPVETRKDVTKSDFYPVKTHKTASSLVKCGKDGEEESDSSALSCDVTDDSCSWNQVPLLEKVVVVEKTIESLNSVKDNHDSKVPTNDQVESSRKSGLKNPKVSGLIRRVSFDPLALLLDAALEGELELVKKTASQVLTLELNSLIYDHDIQVPDPSAVKDEGITALHNAICAGHFPIVRFLVEIGCDVNAQDSDGW